MSDKLTIKDETAAIDTGARDLWDNLTDDQRKQISLYILIRYASSIKTNDTDAQELAIFKTNEYYNKNFFLLSKHPKLLWYLVCMCGNEKKKIYFHEWIGYKKSPKSNNNKLFNFIAEKYPHMKSQEIEMMIKLSSKKEIKTFIEDFGLEDSEIKKLL